MTPDELDNNSGLEGHDEDDHDHEQDHDVEEALEEALELDTQSQIFLELRRQNLDVLRLATEIAGYAGPHGPLKPNDLKSAMETIWEVFSEFHAWIDPEEDEDEEDEDYDDEE